MIKKRYSHNFFESQAWQDNKFVCGIDEAGRGCLAGPVVVSAVILNINAKHPLLQDSKVLSQSQRERAYDWIINNSFYAVALTHHRTVDQHNIYQATLRSMKQALLNILAIFPHPHTMLRYVTIDAMPLSYTPLTRDHKTEFHHFPYAESISSSVAAASIIAKVTRDRLMERISLSLPSFNLQKHKGYGTLEHRDAIKIHGQSIIHRITFCNNLFSEKNAHEQQTLF